MNSDQIADILGQLAHTTRKIWGDGPADGEELTRRKEALGERYEKAFYLIYGGMLGDREGATELYQYLIDACGLALCGQLPVIGDNVGGVLETAFRGGGGVLNLQAAKQVGLGGVEVGVFGGFLALGLGGLALGLAGLGGELPQMTADQSGFALLDLLAQPLPLVEGVQLIGCKHKLGVLDGAGMLGAVLVCHDDLSGQRGDLGGGVALGCDLVQLLGAEVGGFVADDLVVRHGGISFSGLVVGVRAVLPAAAGVVGRGCFAVQPC